MIAARNPVAAALPVLGAAPASPGAPAPSPLLVAMVAEWQAVGRQINDPLIEDGPEADALSSWHDDLQRAICLFPAGSVLDLMAKAPVFRDEARDAVSGLTEGLDPKDTLAGAAWHGLLRDFERLAHGIGQAAPRPHDPILSRISETRAALGRALAVLADHRRDTPGADLPPLWFEASDMAQEAFRRALAIPPTTEAGRCALARLMLDLREGLGLDFEEEITVVLRAVAGGTGEAPAPEPSLFDQILACWREWSIITDPGDEDDDPVALKRIGDRRNALLDAADRLPTTPENVPAKALALAWLEYVALWENGRVRDGYDLDGRLALDIDTAICGRLATKA